MGGKRIIKSTITALFLSAQSAFAWEFTADPICTLHNAGDTLDVKVTYDGDLYTIYLTHSSGWLDAANFSLSFVPFGPNIQTNRQMIIGTTLSVTDTGFGNVLSGLQMNKRAIATLGTRRNEIDLDGASEPTKAFRACDPVVATS